MSRRNCYFKNMILKTELQNNFIMRVFPCKVCFGTSEMASTCFICVFNHQEEEKMAVSAVKQSFS